MNSPRQTPATMRYFLARIKPLAKAKFWLPPTLLVFAGICGWQYWNHREWLGSNLNNAAPQSPNAEAPATSLLEDPLERLAVDAPEAQLGTAPEGQINPFPLGSPLAPPLAPPTDKGKPEDTIANNPLSQLTQSPQAAGKSQQSQIFGPLMPSFKNIPTPTASELLKSTAPNSIAPQTTGLPPISVTENPLRKALERQNTTQPQPLSPSPQQPSFSNQPRNPNNIVPGQAPNVTSPQPYYTYGGQVAPTQPPTINQGPNYLNNPNYGYGSQPVQPNTGYGNQANPSNSNNQPSRSPQVSPFDAPNYSSFQ